MQILPTQYLTPEYPPACPDDFIGPAHDAAVSLSRIVAHSLAHDCPPIKIFYGGESGTGKTALALYAQHLLKVSRFALYEFNGTDVTVDALRELQATLHLCHNEMFGLYRLICIHEVDKQSDAAQVKALTLIDNLPRRTALICTTNKTLKEMETRYQRRFKYTEIKRPGYEEIQNLLLRWPLPGPVAKMIAVNCCGNVGLAMTEAEEWLQTQPIAEAA